MKKYYLLVLFVASTLGLDANIDPKTNKSQCRMDSAELNLCEDISYRIKNDLLTGRWSEDLETSTVGNSVERIYDFQAIGLVEIITFFEDGQSELTKKIWRVDEVNNQAFLILTDIGTDESSTYLLEQTCHGMVLKDKVLKKEVNWIVQ